MCSRLTHRKRRAFYSTCLANGLCITRSPDSNAETHQVARQPGAVE